MRTDKPIAKIGRGGVPILENGLTIYQDKVIEAALQTGFKSIKKLFAFCKVPVRNFYSWMKDSAPFRKAWEDAWGRQMSHYLPAVVEAVAKRAMKTGDPQAARLLLELKGLSKATIKVEHFTDEELNARIRQLAKEAGIDAASGGSGATEKGQGEERPEGDQHTRREA